MGSGGQEGHWAGGQEGNQTYLQLTLGYVAGDGFNQEVASESHGVQCVIGLSNELRNVSDLLYEAGHGGVEIGLGRTSQGTHLLGDTHQLR